MDFATPASLSGAVLDASNVTEEVQCVRGSMKQTSAVRDAADLCVCGLL